MLELNHRRDDGALHPLIFNLDVVQIISISEEPLGKWREVEWTFYPSVERYSTIVTDSLESLKERIFRIKNEETE